MVYESNMYLYEVNLNFLIIKIIMIGKIPGILEAN